jgi:hypothetical protein
MSGANVKFDGFGNLVTIFREMPDDGYRRPVVAAFRKAALPVKQAMASGLPPNLKQFSKVIKIKPGKGKSMTLAVGFFGRQGVYVNHKGQKWDPYMLLYWHNYGTLANRSGEHQFQNARRKPSLSWMGGIKSALFVEKAIDSSMPQAEKVFETAYITEHEKFLQKKSSKIK